MIDRENFDYIKNIVRIKEEHDITSLYDILTVLKNNPEKTPSILIDKAQSLSCLQKNYDEIIRSLNDNDFVNFYTLAIELINKDIDTTLLVNVLKTIKDLPDCQKTICDAFSINQFTSKSALLSVADNLNILNKKYNVAIWGSWYGSILIPMLAEKVNKIICIDLDESALQIAKNRIFPNYKNIEYICDDVFKTYRDAYLDTNLIINTSCEHMPPMKDWKWFGAGALSTDQDTTVFRNPKLPDECYFAFQSNNMFNIEGHINCVNNMEEFKEQLPQRAEVLYEKEIVDTRGTRYMLVGKFNSL